MNNNSRCAWRWIGMGAVALMLPLAVAAQQAFTRNPVPLRAGPGGNYPLVVQLGPGQPLDVSGCTGGYSWCDVILPDGLRGWVRSTNLDYAYQDQRVPLATYGAVIGVPIVGFAIGSYWANYYRDRPWYGDRRWWGNRRPPPAMGWVRPPIVRPGWQPHPFPGPGFRPPGPGFRPHPPGPGFRPRPGPGGGHGGGPGHGGGHGGGPGHGGGHGGGPGHGGGHGGGPGHGGGHGGGPGGHHR